METIFYLAAAVAVAGTLMMLTRLNAVHALLYLIVSLLAVAVVFYVIGAPFIAALEVTIYAGAIMVLFIFVVMMLNLGERATAIERTWLRPGMWIGPVILAGVFTAMLLSLAGIPLTAGFLGKFYILAAGASSATWALIVILVVTSWIGLFYYLRIIVVMFGKAPAGARPLALSMPLSLGDGLVLAVLATLLVWFGIYPAPLLNLIRTAIAGLA